MIECLTLSRPLHIQLLDCRPRIEISIQVILDAGLVGILTDTLYSGTKQRVCARTKITVLKDVVRIDMTDRNNLPQQLHHLQFVLSRIRFTSKGQPVI